MNLMLGAITLFAGDYAPVGFAKCDGSLLSITKNVQLFSILKTSYGGDGRSNFALPKLPSVEGAIYIIATEGYYPGHPAD
ncbi:phage tail protein [Pedobacter jeongneungensis]|jgi:microcystin-dependent protein|uniref:phage tail protein n=1 Tax=Pedobacter jeongneungensis TaxID=947309 RepID=UPI000468BADB|nr:tail fiber protein [Pedobacter jeongneungensis]